MLLIYPPVAKPCEPPPGVALLAGVLRRHGARCAVWDASIDAVIHGIHQDGGAREDTWTARGRRHRAGHLELLRGWAAASNLDRYRRAVVDLNRVLEVNTRTGSLAAGLGNLSGEELLPVRSDHLLAAAERPEKIPFHEFLRGRLVQIVEAVSPDVIGLSLGFMSQALCTFAMIGMTRRLFPAIRIVLGGGLVTSWKRRPGWSNPFGGLVDDLVDGPGETFLLGIAKPGSPPPSSALADYSDMPWDQYLSPGRILPYAASSGCYWNRCAFCPERAEGSPYRAVPPEGVLDDLRHHIDGSAPSLIHLVDNAVSPALLSALCRSPLPVPWYGFVRVTRDLGDSDRCRALRRSGCAMLKLGIESGSQRVLDAEGKGMEIEWAERALRCLKEAGIATYVYLLLGTVSETEADARLTLDFAARNSGFIDHLNLALFNLPLNSDRSRDLEIYRHYEGDLSLYAGFKHPLGWDRSRVRRFLDREFKRHPAIAQILKREPPIFTSNHAPLFSATMKALREGRQHAGR
ncbi:MAG: radical SAM protein [Syntrophobacteraceae bacterium]|nr:radical SAM protein [Syntrophobacteraceae bacterium]